MRTDDEILARIEAIKEQDFFGFKTGDLVCRLPFEKAKPFLKDDATPEQWGDQRPLDPESIKAEMLDYMAFAWDKANNCRGISAGRSIDHMSVWLWLMDRDAAAEQILDYDQYGKPQLRAICEEFGWDWRQWDDGSWKNDEMSDGSAPPETVPALAS